MTIFSRAKAALASAAVAAAIGGFGIAASADTTVVVGYQQIVGPYVAAIAAGRFDQPLKDAGYTIQWRQFASAGDVAGVLASHSVPVGVIGSTGATAFVTRGIDCELFWILDNIGKSEALIARDGSGITKPADLKGKKVAVPFVSTSHFHLLVAMTKLWNMKPSDVQLLNMRPPEIVAAWKRGDIDAAYVWPPALSEIEKTGKEITNSAIIGKASVPTFDGIVADRQWAKANPKFMAAFTKVLAEVYDEYNKNPNWTADSPEVKGIVKMIGGTPEDTVAASHLLQYPSSKEQASTTWLGGGAESGAVKSMTASAAFLKDQKQVDNVLPDYTPYVDSSFAQAASQQ